MLESLVMSAAPPRLHRTFNHVRQGLELYKSPEIFPFFLGRKDSLEAMANRSAKGDEPHGQNHE